jgi:hypothetical protein
VIAVEKAPSAFGEVSFRVESKLKQGEVLLTVEAPSRPVKKWQLRLPDPPGHKITGFRIGSDDAPRDADGRIDLLPRKGSFTVLCQVQPRR